MRNVIFILLLTLVYSGKIFSQTDTSAKIIVKGRTHFYERITNKGSFSYRNIKSKFRDKHYGIGQWGTADFSFPDQKFLLNAFKDVLSQAELEAFRGKRMFLNIIHNRDGEVEDIYFIIPFQVKIEAGKVEELEKRIRTGLKVDLNTVSKPGAKYFSITYPVSFNKIIDNTLLLQPGSNAYQ